MKEPAAEPCMLELMRKLVVQIANLQSCWATQMCHVSYLNFPQHHFQLHFYFHYQFRFLSIRLILTHLTKQEIIQFGVLKLRGRCKCASYIENNSHGRAA